MSNSILKRWSTTRDFMLAKILKTIHRQGFCSRTLERNVKLVYNEHTEESRILRISLGICDVRDSSASWPSNIMLAKRNRWVADARSTIVPSLYFVSHSLFLFLSNTHIYPLFLATFDRFLPLRFAIVPRPASLLHPRVVVSFPVLLPHLRLSSFHLFPFYSLHESTRPSLGFATRRSLSRALSVSLGSFARSRLSSFPRIHKGAGTSTSTRAQPRLKAMKLHARERPTNRDRTCDSQERKREREKGSG